MNKLWKDREEIISKIRVHIKQTNLHSYKALKINIKVIKTKNCIQLIRDNFKSPKK